MNFDLRLPIGLLFSFYGVLLAGYGIMTRDSKEMYERSLDINVNLYWGLVLLVFGGAMLLMSLRSKPQVQENKTAGEPKMPTSTGA
jgi:hypothetical protein